MKNMKLAALALSLVGILSAGNALAVDSTQVDVSATVAGTCNFNATNYAMAFGTINSTDTGAKTATAAVQFTCTNNTVYSINDVSGANSMTHDTLAESLAYDVAAYTLTDTADGALTTVNLVGTITQTDYQAASAGLYEDALTLNILP